MQFRTEVKFKSDNLAIEFTDKILSIGSCFSENIGTRMQTNRMDVVVNPFGILYNPASIERTLLKIIKNASYQESDLVLIRGRYYSFDHHGSFSGEDLNNVLVNINEKINIAHNQLLNAKLIMITFGTAYCYVHKDLKRVVANCHKLPHEVFDRKKLVSEEIVRNYIDVFQSIKKLNPNIKICLTVSPIRHWKDGAVENNRSKSVLIQAVSDLTQELSSYVSYFPSYEYLLDELRDYRFYAADMLHPNELALDFISQKFKEIHFTEKCQKVLGHIKKINQAKMHRALFPGSDEHEKFKRDQRDNIAQLKEQFPFLNLEEDLQFFS